MLKKEMKTKMKPPERVMVILNEKYLDDPVIGYAQLLANMFKPKQVYFVFFHGGHDLPGEVLSRYPELAEPEDESALTKRQQLVEDRFKGILNCQIIFETLKGPGIAKLLRFSWKQKIDLIVTGKPVKKDPDHHGSPAEKIARRAPCPVLLIPGGSKPAIENILAPVDFSVNSRLAFDSAILFAAAAKIKQIFCLNVFRVPMEYERTGTSYEDFSRIMEDIARLAYKNFIKPIDTGKINVTPIFWSSDYPVESIQEVAKNEAIDLIVIGNKGKHSALLLGSVSERLIRVSKIPLLVAKRRGIWINLIKTFINLYYSSNRSN